MHSKVRRGRIRISKNWIVKNYRNRQWIAKLVDNWKKWDFIKSKIKRVE
jgi:hypothetical protein